MGHSVCVLGYTYRDALALLDLLCKENQDDILKRRVGVAVMTDGTELVAISIDESSQFTGRQFDYVFYEEVLLPLYCIIYSNALEYLGQRCLAHSDIPREFQWCAVDTNI